MRVSEKVEQDEVVDSVQDCGQRAVPLEERVRRR